MIPEGVIRGIEDIDNGRTAGVEDLQDVLHEVNHALNEQLDCELKAAYRMGYDYVHVYWRISPETFRQELRCYHSNTAHPLRGFKKLTYRTTYSLREEDLSEKVRRELQA